MTKKKSRRLKFPKIPTQTLIIGMIVGWILSPIARDNALGAIVLALIITLLYGLIESKLNDTEGWHRALEESLEDKDQNKHLVRTTKLGSS